MISIIIPVYNVEKYLEQCLKSIFNQSYNNIEVIIVNDGSTDKSEQIIKKYAKKYTNLIYIKQENQGVSKARNLGISMANGDYIVFIDPDDFLELDALENMYSKAKENDLDLVIIGYKEVYDDNIEGKDTIKVLNKSEYKVYYGNEVANMMLRLEILGFSWDKMFKTKLIKEKNLEFEDNRYVEDWYPMFVQVFNSKKIGFINKPLYNYRQRGSSTVHKRNEKYLIDYSYAVSNIIKYIEKNNWCLNTEDIHYFKVETFNNVIAMYNDFNFHKDSKSKLFRNLKTLDYSDCEVSLGKILSMKSINIKTKISIILWKLRLRDTAINIKNKLVNKK